MTTRRARRTAAVERKSTGSAIVCESVVRIHRAQDTEVLAVRSVDLVVEPGEIVGVVGPSGSGKSTLLSLLAGLTRPSAGRVEVLGRDLGRLSARELLALRGGELGILLQNPERNLLPYGTVVDNLDFARLNAPMPRSERRRQAEELLDAVGLGGAAGKRVRQLSGGEQQRLSLAVAVAAKPRLLLADEPTSQLDRSNADTVAALLAETRHRWGTSVVLVTHDADLGHCADRTLAMRDGRLGTEARDGQDYAIVAADGSLQLPEAALVDFPPGSRARVVHRGDRWELQQPRDVTTPPGGRP